ncbi:trypsin-like peptidase domain-containing protein [Streptomyces celluloflavus]|uniref:trypsin-like peptidase domain-containing protein n=1 Tax=Streptomyces celluloflavus TaxID=58344 RepID=UPI003667A04F
MSVEGLQAWRAAEVIVELSADGGRRRGSGYLVAPGKVLTAAHVVEGGAEISARLDADRPGEQVAQADVAWAHAGIDVAVLAIPERNMDAELTPFGQVGEQDAVLQCSALGFPVFKLREYADERGGGSRYRDSAHIHASCTVLANRREGTLDLAVPPPEPGQDKARSPWEGMSGAVVFSSGHIVGVITKHHRSDGPGRLAASRVDRWVEQLTNSELRELEALLGHGLTPDALPDVIPPYGLSLINAAYREQLTDTAPEQLLGRETELERLAAFCAGTEPYLWIQGPPWAGKTALAAWFALNPPRGVVPVWFFVTARSAGQADSTVWREAVTYQLAAIAGREPDPRLPATAQDGELSLLLKQAAERVASQGGTLLLIVDGLDEDRSHERGGSGRSVARQLPRRLPPNVRVLATGRPQPGVPSDVHGDHPLRGCERWRLSPSKAAEHTRHEAEADLELALALGDVGHDLLGLLAAAHGSLTLDDLRELTGRPGYDIARCLDGSFGRLLRRAGSSSVSSMLMEGDIGSDHVDSRGFRFAHETLFRTALDRLGPDLGPYRERIHAWGARYSEQGWPADTPAYLLHGYPRMSLAQSDLRRAVALATDTCRHDRLRADTGSDAAALVEIEAVRAAVCAEAPDDLIALAVLAAIRDMVTHNNASLHPAVAVAYARLGEVRRAIGLARSVLRTEDRAWGLARVARVLAERGDARAAAVAREAMETAGAVSPVLHRTLRREVIRASSVALTMAGAQSDALALVHGLAPDTARQAQAEVSSKSYKPSNENALEWLLALAELTAVGHRQALQLLDQAENLVDALDKTLSPEDRIRTLSALAAVHAPLEPERAKRLYALIAELATEENECMRLSAGARALREARPSIAAHLAARAAQLTEESRSATHGSLLATVEALALGDSPETAQRLLEAVKNRVFSGPQPWGSFVNACYTVAESWARLGDRKAAWEAFFRGMCAQPHDIRSTGLVAAAAEGLVAAGAREPTEPPTWADAWRVAELFATLAGEFADSAPEQARQFLERAERVPEWASRKAVLEAGAEHLADLAPALAALGREDQAEQLAELQADRHRIRSQASVAIVLADRDSGRAQDLIRRATHGVWESRSLVDIAMVVEACARVGAWDEAVALAERVQSWSEVPWVLRAFARDRWLSGPAAAQRLAEALEHDINTNRKSPGRAGAGLMALCALVGTPIPQCAAQWRELLLRKDPYWFSLDRPQDLLLLCLLTFPDTPNEVKQHLAEVGAILATASDGRDFAYGDSLALSLIHIVLGDVAGAVGVAEGLPLTHGGGWSPAALGGLLAGARIEPSMLRFSAMVSSNLVGAALQITARYAPRDPGLARTLLSRALQGSAWHATLPALAEVEPEAVLRVRDIIFAHLGLESTDT